MRIFELGPDRKFRASTGPNGNVRIELRTPSDWTTSIPADMMTQALNALALSAAGEPPQGFRFTQDERYFGAQDVRSMNPFHARRLQNR